MHSANPAHLLMVESALQGLLNSADPGAFLSRIPGTRYHCGRRLADGVEDAVQILQHVGVRVSKAAAGGGKGGAPFEVAIINAELFVSIWIGFAALRCSWTAAAAVVDVVADD